MAMAGPLRKAELKLDEKISGAKPAMVVMEVNTIGLNRVLADSLMAMAKDSPSCNLSLRVPIKTRVLLTNTPKRAMVPMRLKMFKAIPCI